MKIQVVVTKEEEMIMNLSFEEGDTAEIPATYQAEVTFNGPDGEIIKKMCTLNIGK